MMNIRNVFVTGLAVASIAVPVSASGNGWKFQPPGWRFAGADIQDTHAQPGEIVLNRFTVPYLTQRWVVNMTDSVVATPAIVGRDLYVPDNGGWLYRIDALTGHVIWQVKISDYSGTSTSYSRTTPAIDGNMLVIGDRTSATVFGIDRFSGRLVWKQQLDTAAGAIITGAAVIADGRVYIGVSSNQEDLAVNKGFVLTFRGQVAALDLASGQVVWQFRTVPEGYTGGAVWSGSSAVDLRRGSLYVSVGNNYSVPASVAQCQLDAKTPEEKDACASPDDHYDAVLSLGLSSGRLKWARTFEGPDAWTVSCLVKGPVGVPCPNPKGPDHDFGAGPNLYTTRAGGRTVDLVGAGQKSGIYWALDPDDGHTVWAAQAGPGGGLGGVLWGTATDGMQVYTGIGNNNHVQTVLTPSGKTISGGFWTALDAATGAVRWQMAAIGQDPQAPANTSLAPGSVSVANNVLYGEDNAGYFAALDALTGAVLWTFQAGDSPLAGPAILNGSLYWGTKGKLYAFGLPGR
jgi:polyvinyl alcohol dehydrogenase (cytochrome)